MAVAVGSLYQFFSSDYFPQFLLTRQKSSLCAGAHSRSAAIEQTRKDRSEVDARRRHVRCPKKMNSKKGRSARPNWQLSTKHTPSPVRHQWGNTFSISRGTPRGG